MEELTLKLKLQYFGHLMLGKTEDKRRVWQNMSWFDSITDSMDMNLSKLWEILEDRGAWQPIFHRVAKKSDTK